MELPERAPRLGKTRISAVSAMSGMAWPNRGLKDMTSMSGLRQGFPQENGLRPVVQHAWRVRRAADCLRFASPAEATGGLEAWSLEAWSLEAWKRLGRGLKYVVGGVLEAQISTKMAPGRGISGSSDQSCIQ